MANLWQWIRELFEDIKMARTVHDMNSELINANISLQKKLEETEQRNHCSPSNCMRNILVGDLSWYSYEGLPPVEQRNYLKDVEHLLRNKSLVNELNFLLNEILKKLAHEPQTLEQLRDLQMTAVALESIKVHLQSLPMVQEEKKEEDFDKYAPV